MKIIVGLGNPGEEYVGTRHNIGFEILTLIQKEWGFPPFEFNKKFDAEVSSADYKPGDTSHKLILVKPQTFVNLSGEAVAKILDFYKLTPDDIIVIHDELDIALGKFKIATDSSSAGHNGVQNIIDRLGTQKLKRIRVGIGEEISGAPVCRTDAHAFVLGKFSEEEQNKIKQCCDFDIEIIYKEQTPI